MAFTIPDAFDSVAPNYRVDSAFIKKLHTFRIWFQTNSPDHIAFFGSNLVGVHKLRFNPPDRDMWFDEILGVDELNLVDAISRVDGLDSTWKRATDSFNLSCIWIIHQIYKSKLISQKEKEQGLMDGVLMLQYRFVSSLVSHFFKYTADEATMLATYANMSRKFTLKTAGSWAVLLEQRGKAILAPSGIHYKTYTKFDSNKSIIYMVSDIQGRLREIIKAVAALFYKTREEGGKIASDKAIDNINGEDVLKEKTRHYSTLIRYCHSTLPDLNNWIKKELEDVVLDLIPNLSPKYLNESLKWLSLNVSAKHNESIELLINETLIFAFDYINKNRSLYGKASGIIPLMTKLKGIYSASRMSDPTLMKVKEIVEKLIQLAIGHKPSSTIAALRVGIQLYIVLRTMAMRHYQK